MFVVVTYDVNAKRIPAVEKFLRRYLAHVQNSVFEGELGKAEIDEIESGLKRIISPDQDSVRIYIFERRGCVRTRSLGAQEDPSEII